MSLRTSGLRSLTAVNLETFKEFNDLMAANLTATHLDTLKEDKDLTATILTSTNLVLQSHTQGSERRQTIA